MQLNSISQFLLCCQHSSYIFYCMNKLIPFNGLQKHQRKKKDQHRTILPNQAYIQKRKTQGLFCSFFFFCKTKWKKKNLFCISDKPGIALFNFWKTRIIQSKILLWIKNRQSCLQRCGTGNLTYQLHKIKANEVMAEKANCYTSNNCGVFMSAENDCKLHVSIIWMIVVHSYVFL